MKLRVNGRGDQKSPPPKDFSPNPRSDSVLPWEESKQETVTPEGLTEFSMEVGLTLTQNYNSYRTSLTGKIIINPIRATIDQIDELGTFLRTKCYQQIDALMRVD